MNKSATRYLSAIAVWVCLIITLCAPTASGAQVNQQDDGTWINPNRELDRTASLARDHPDEQSVRAVTEAVFSFPHALPRSPGLVEDMVKGRLVQAELAYREHRGAGVDEKAVVKLFEQMTQSLGLPEYAKTSAKQVRELRMIALSQTPVFMGAGSIRPATKPGEAINSEMSPLQATHLIGVLLDQKFVNPEFQVTPAEWDAGAKERQLKRARLQQALAQSPDKPDAPAKHYLIMQNASKRVEMHRAWHQGMSSLGTGEALNLIDSAFKTLDIDR